MVDHHPDDHACFLRDLLGVTNNTWVVARKKKHTTLVAMVMCSGTWQATTNGMEQETYHMSQVSSVHGREDVATISAC